jgi:hypothetical protein
LCVLSLVEQSPCLKHKLEPLFYAFLTFLLWFSDVFSVGFGHSNCFLHFLWYQNCILVMSDSVCCTSGVDFFSVLNDHCFEVHVVTATCPPIQYPQHCGISHFSMVTHDSYHGILLVCFCMYKC